jgi:hypothetical protein
VPGVARHVAVGPQIAAKLFVFCSLFRGNAAGSCNKGLPPNGSIACLTCSFTSLQFMVGLNKKLEPVSGHDVAFVLSAYRLLAVCFDVYISGSSTLCICCIPTPQERLVSESQNR